jgi:hypothetical protein
MKLKNKSINKMIQNKKITIKRMSTKFDKKKLTRSKHKGWNKK